jgi:hypothetical protein
MLYSECVCTKDVLYVFERAQLARSVKDVNLKFSLPTDTHTARVHCFELAHLMFHLILGKYLAK